MLHAWWAERLGERRALHTPHGDRTWVELNANINRLVRALRTRGLRAGDAVAMMCTNGPEFIEVLYAAQRGGFRLTPINWHLTGDEAGYMVATARRRRSLLGRAGRRRGRPQQPPRAGPAWSRWRSATAARCRPASRATPVCWRPTTVPTSRTRSWAPRCSTPRARRGDPRACTATRRRRPARWPRSTSAATTRTGRRRSTAT